MNPHTVDEAQRLLEGVEPTCEYRDAHGEMVCSTEASWLLRVNCGDSAFFCESHCRSLQRDLSIGHELLRCAKHGGKRVLYDWVAI